MNPKLHPRLSPALELCVCRPAAGLTEADYRAALRAADDFLNGCGGFEGRELLYSASSDLWIDLVHWSSPEAAGAAMSAFAGVEAIQPLARQLIVERMLLLSRRPELACAGKAAADAAPVYEVILYRLKPEASEDKFARRLEAFGAAMSSMDGFSGRDVFRDEESGTWAEVVRYADQAAVDRLGPIVMSLPEAAAAMECIDESSVAMWFASRA